MAQETLVESMLEVREPGRSPVKHALRGMTLRVGRGDDARVEIQLEARSVSRHHFTIERREGGFWLSDAGNNRNGTKVNGARVEATRLRDGDRIVAGEVEMQFHDAGFDSFGPNTVIAGSTPPPQLTPPPYTEPSAVITEDNKLTRTLILAAAIALAAVAGVGVAIRILGG